MDNQLYKWMRYAPEPKYNNEDLAKNISLGLIVVTGAVLLVLAGKAVLIGYFHV